MRMLSIFGAIIKGQTYEQSGPYYRTLCEHFPKVQDNRLYVNHLSWFRSNNLQNFSGLTQNVSFLLKLNVGCDSALGLVYPGAQGEGTASI